MPVFPTLFTAPPHPALPRDASRLLLGCTLKVGRDGVPKRAASLDTIEKTLKTLGLRVDSDPRRDKLMDLDSARARINHTQWALWVRDTIGKPVDDGRIAKAREKLDEFCDWIGPVYVSTLPSGQQERVCPLPNVLLVTLHPQLSGPEIDHALLVLREFGLDEHAERSRDLRARYMVLRDRMKRTVYDLVDEIAQILEHAISRLEFEHMPHASPWLYEPRDPHYAAQWNMPIIHAPEAWDITRGDPSVVIAVLDSGVDLSHPDLDTLPGVNLRDPTINGRPVPGMFGPLNPHGTHVAGIAAAIVDNAPTPLGIVGVAGRCRLLPLAFDGATDAQVAAGINRAVAEGARVINISMSGWWYSVLSGEVGDAIIAADAAGVVLCASAGNGDVRGIVSPARHHLVMACGGSDRTDARWSTVLPTGEIRGSNYGDETFGGVRSGISVVAPAWDLFPSVGMPTTDMVGTAGHEAFPSPAGDYWVIGGFTATSAATPHVSGVAALLFSRYPTLNGNEVRRIIERTADKVGPVPYAVVDGFPNGTRNEEMGYGRLNAFRAVDFADVMIRDWSGDTGEEPSTPPGGRFWVSPDIVVRPENDGVFAPADPLLSSQLLADAENFVYVQVLNNGPAVARNVRVTLRAVIGAASFVYPEDWQRTDESHISPEEMTVDFPTVPVGEPVRAVFRFTVEQSTQLAAWSDRGQHPCLLAEVQADNDHAFAASRDSGDSLIARRNNLAQRNLQVVRRTSAPLMHAYAVDVSHEGEADDELFVRIDAGALARDGLVTLCVDPVVDRPSPSATDQQRTLTHVTPTPRTRCEHRLVLLDPARVASYQCGCETVFTLPAGAELAVGSPGRTRIVRTEGAVPADAQDGDQCVRVVKSDALLVIARPTDRRYAVHLWREDATRHLLGGVTLVIEPTGD